MHEPTINTTVTLSVPQRESVRASVRDRGPGWLELQLLESPRTGWDRLERCQVFVQWADSVGLGRLTGQVARVTGGGRKIVGFGRGEVVRFSHRGHAQLLRRSEAITTATTARITVIKVGPDQVARSALAVTLGGAGMRVRGMVAPRPHELYHFDLEVPDGPIVQGQFRVLGVSADGVADVRFTILSPRDKAAIVGYASGRAA